jgi:hypothetical protein
MVLRGARPPVPRDSWGRSVEELRGVEGVECHVEQRGDV